MFFFHLPHIQVTVFPSRRFIILKILVGLANALYEEFGHERKKLEEIRGPVVEENEEGITDESGELDRTLQSLLLWTFSQTNKFPGVRHVPRCQKIIKELSIGVNTETINIIFKILHE